MDALHAQIIKYLGRVSRQKMGEGLTDELIGMMEATNAIEAIGDLIETDLVGMGLSRIEQRITVSDETEHRLTEFHGLVVESFATAVRAFSQRDGEAVKRVKQQRKELDRMERDILAHQAERLVADEPRRARTYRLEIDLVFALKRVQYFSRRIARTVIPIETRASEG